MTQKFNAEVCLTPLLAENYPATGRLVVIIDILRATSCWVTALHNGAAAIHPVSTLAACKAWMEKGYIGAAERQGVKPEGFDLGNSPFEYTRKKIGGRKIAVTTTNGSRAIESFKGGEVIIGSFLNISAVTNYIKRNAQNVLFVCAGWEGNISPEDMIFAGAILEQLGSVIGSMDDAAVIALNSWKNNKPEFRAWLRQTSHVQRLLKLGLAKDIEYCFSLDLFPGVPLLSGREIIMTLIIS